jgi:hypothetical protein
MNARSTAARGIEKITVPERPGLPHGGVGRPGERLAHLPHVLVEPLDQLRRRGEARPRERRVFGQAEVERFLLQRIAAPHR